MNRLRFQRSQLCIPYGLFLVCFVFAPLVVIIYYAFTDGDEEEKEEGAGTLGGQKHCIFLELEL